MKKKVKRLKLRTTHYSHRYLTILLLDRFHINLFCPVAYVFATNLSILKWPTNNQSQLAISPSSLSLSLSLSLSYNKLEAGGIWTQGSSPTGQCTKPRGCWFVWPNVGLCFPKSLHYNNLLFYFLSCYKKPFDGRMKSICMPHGWNSVERSIMIHAGAKC